MSKIIQLCLIEETDPRTNKKYLAASHGVNIETGEHITVSSEPLNELGAVYDEDYGWILVED